MIEPTEPVQIVGIGASAGGLDAIRSVLANAHDAAATAFVVLQHLAPSQTGMLRNALAGSTTLPIVDLTTTTRIEPGHVYLVPPRVEVALVDGAFATRQVEADERGRLPIDILLRSLAEALGPRSIGVVLSGTATDGTDGLRAIRAAGGTTFAQDPATAQFDEMPRNAIASGAVSIVLSPDEIGKALGRLRSGTRPATGLDQILSHLCDVTGVDFTEYKRATIERRIARRLAEHKLADLGGYARYIAEHPGEASVLYEDLLIHVTEFFRDAQLVDRLATQVFPEILDQLPANDAIRIWVAGCSTGQEPYSLAMLLIEQFERTGRHRPIQIFGTDLSERAVTTARAAHYPASIADQVGPARLARFFQPSDGGWRVNQDVRESCVFVRHDLTADPPFSKLDVISCRNVLIYLGPSLQQGVIPMFHYALNQPGYLVLGRAENIAGFDSLFAPLEPGVAIFRRRASVGRSALAFPAAKRSLHQRVPGDGPSTAVDIQRDADHILLARYAPACVLVDEAGEIVQYRGRTGVVLEPSSGLPQHNLFKMIRGGLGPDVREALQRARRTDAAVRLEGLTLREPDDVRRVNVEVVPLMSGANRGGGDSDCLPGGAGRSALGAFGAATQKRHFVVAFEVAPRDPASPPVDAASPVPSGEPDELVRVRQELVATKEYLRSAIAQHAVANQDLEVANEELQSMNEELQSMNEELQTAKEELQSTNEELQTVNEELQRGNRDLASANDDLVNVLATVDIAIIIVDTERRIRRFTPRARGVLNLIPGDVGRRIGELQPNVAIAGLEDTIGRVIETLAVSETEVSDPRGACYRMQIRPYRTSDNSIGGAVISFVDISALRNGLDEARRARDRADAIVDTVPNPLVVLECASPSDREPQIRSSNRAFHRAFHAVASPFTRAGLGPLYESFETMIAGGQPFDDVVIEDAARTWSVNGRALARDGAQLPAMLVGMLDISEQVRAGQERARMRQIAADVADRAACERDAFLNAVSHELRTPLNAILLWTELLRRGDGDATQFSRGLDTIEQSALAEAQLIDDLLDLALSRTPNEGLAVTLTRAAPAPLIAAAIDAVRGDAAAKQITLDAALDADVLVEVDPRRLHQVARNLVTNAIKFTPDGGRVAVSLARRDAHLELSVRDFGSGISAEFLPHVFEPFGKRDQSATRAQHGLGIGLALVRHLVERQGGTIRVTSAGEGLGATFTVELPIAPPT